MTKQQGTHIEAPVERVFNFFRDPNNWQTLPHADRIKEVKLTKGVGTYYRVILPVPVLHPEASGVFTEFIPNRRITDRSSLSLAGTLTFSFAAERSGTNITMESQPRSVWRIPPLANLARWILLRRHRRYMSALKQRMEISA
ncbi:MAG TPA: SRPBCC family protein [Candidatus Dormibacteraeota bacterium]